MQKKKKKCFHLALSPIARLSLTPELLEIKATLVITGLASADAGGDANAEADADVGADVDVDADAKTDAEVDTGDDVDADAIVFSSVSLPGMAVLSVDEYSATEFNPCLDFPFLFFISHFGPYSCRCSPFPICHVCLFSTLSRSFCLFFLAKPSLNDVFSRI